MTHNRPEALLETALGEILDPELPLEARCAQIAALRQAHPNLAGPLDLALLQREQSRAEALTQVRGVVEELRQTVEHLTAVPLREGRFIESCGLPDGRALVRVAVNGQNEVLVGLQDESILPDLRLGDRVLLTSSGNAVIAKLDSAAGAGECATVERWVGNGRLALRLRDQTSVLRAAAALTPETVSAGDLVRVEAASGLAVERIEPDARSAYAPSDEATSLGPEALAGCDEVRDGALRRVLYAVAHPEVAAVYGMQHQRPWILLGGAPGLGKTTLARVAAGELQRQTGRRCQIRKVGAELVSSWVGETEQRIRTLVREIRSSDEASIVFIDEAEAIARTRGSAGNVHSDRFLNTWLAELEGFEGRAPCVLIAATNRLDLLDPAFRSRFAIEIVMPRPRMAAARAIFGVHLDPSLPFDARDGDSAKLRSRLIESAVARLYLPNSPGAMLATLKLRDGRTRAVQARDLMSGRLIEQICVDARERAFQRHVDGNPRGIGVEDMDEAVDAAMDRLRLTLTPANAHSYLTDLRRDVGVVAIEPATPVRGGVAFLHTAAA